MHHRDLVGPTMHSRSPAMCDVSNTRKQMTENGSHGNLAYLALLVTQYGYSCRHCVLFRRHRQSRRRLVRDGQVRMLLDFHLNLRALSSLPSHCQKSLDTHVTARCSTMKESMFSSATKENYFLIMERHSNYWSCCRTQTQTKSFFLANTNQMKACDHSACDRPVKS